MHELKVIDIEKKYKNKSAVNKITLSFQQGVYGLLGENGAGKTTLMRMLSGILKPTSGNVYCDNIEIHRLGGEYRKLLGYLPQEFGYYAEFSAIRFMRYMSALKAIPKERAEGKIIELLRLVGLEEEKNKKLSQYSGGMLRRIGIAQALLNDPEILILDEPTAGLDPKERVRFRNIISSLGRDRIVILSTHIVTDIDYIADRIIMMKDGSVIQEGTEEEITLVAGECVWECLTCDKEADILNQKYIVTNLRNQNNQIKLRIVSKTKPTEEAVLVKATLEDVYLYCTQEQIREENKTNEVI